LSDPPLCECHGLPMGLQKRKPPRRDNWECRERRREHNRRRNAQRVAWVQARRDQDPIFRISELLSTRRRSALKRMAARHLPREERLGKVPDQRPG